MNIHQPVYGDTQTTRDIVVRLFMLSIIGKNDKKYTFTFYKHYDDITI